jgi:D-sedoheptulose 7-phosphate isomerase
MTEPHSTLQKLYPHLSTDKGLVPELRESIARKCRDSVDTKQQFFERHADTLIDMASALAEVFQRGGKLLCMGNGGSSCDAAHLSVEFNHPVTTGRPALPAINLCADIATLTAVGNDVGFSAIFQRQVMALGRTGDALFGISTSGDSANLIDAFAAAHAQGLHTFALLGSDGGALATHPAVEHCLVVNSHSVHRIQETHVTCYHILWDLVHTLMAERR